MSNNFYGTNKQRDWYETNVQNYRCPWVALSNTSEAQSYNMYYNTKSNNTFFRDEVYYFVMSTVKNSGLFNSLIKWKVPPWIYSTSLISVSTIKLELISCLADDRLALLFNDNIWVFGIFVQYIIPIGKIIPQTNIKYFFCSYTSSDASRINKIRLWWSANKNA